MLGHVGTSRLIRSYPIQPPVRSSKGQSGVLQAIDISVAGSMTAQPPGIRPSALCVATHGHQMASLWGWGGLSSLQRCSRRILQPQLTGRMQHLNSQCKRETHHTGSPFQLALQVSPRTKKSWMLSMGTTRSP